LRTKLEAADAERVSLSDQSALNTPMVADVLAGGHFGVMVKNLESMPPRQADRATSTLEGLIDESDSISEGQWLTAEFELEGGGSQAAADAKINLVVGARFGTYFHPRRTRIVLR